MCVASSMLQAGAQIVQGVSDWQTGKANANFAMAEGRSAFAASTQEAQQIRDQGARFIGRTQAIQAANGVDITSGSAADVTAESARAIELDALNRSYAGRQAFWGKKVEAIQSKKAGQMSLYSGGLSAIGTAAAGFQKAYPKTFGTG